VADVPFEGFKYDAGRAEAMADAIKATFDRAAVFQVSTPDQLAALAIAAARVIAASKLAKAPQYAADRFQAFLLAWYATREAPGQPGAS
jgi:DNA-binding transcriptional regulator YbjK